MHSANRLLAFYMPAYGARVLVPVPARCWSMPKNAKSSFGETNSLIGMALLQFDTFQFGMTQQQAGETLNRAWNVEL